MRIQGRRFVLTVFAFLAVGCASMPRPGTGDIAFRKVVHTETGTISVMVRSSRKYHYNFQRNPLLARRAER